LIICSHSLSNQLISTTTQKLENHACNNPILSKSKFEK
jgi:hypothetical protein